MKHSGLYQIFREGEILKQIPRGNIIVAVSGGADSVCLLHLICRLREKRGWHITVCHIQHNLRGKESLRDQKFVESLCRKLNVPCVVKSIRVNKKRGTEESARRLRYIEFADIACQTGARAVLTAHTANDQAETFLLHLLRGAGVDGLCGIFPDSGLSGITGENTHKNIRLVRPLLSFGRQEILRYIKSQNLEFCTDSTNRLIKYRRNWVRRKLIPLIEEAQPKIVRRISDFTAIFQKENEIREAQTSEIRKNVLSRDGIRLDLRSFFQYNTSLRSRFLHDMLPHYSFSKIRKILYDLEKLNSRKNGRFICLKDIESLSGHSSAFEGKGRKSFYLDVPGETRSGDWGLKFSSRILSGAQAVSIFRKGARRTRPAAFFDADKASNGGKSARWKVRAWKKGDRFRPFGMAGVKKVQDFFTDGKIPREERAFVPILEAGGKIRWIVGYRTDDESKIDSATKRIIRVQAERI